MPEERDRWPSRASFVLAAVGSAVGLGNVWRFPYVAFKGGGGAFLIPYFIALFTAGIPMLILEMGLGQRLQCSAPLAFGKIRKGLEWFGWWAVGLSAGIVIYYCTLMAWAWNYLYHSFSLAWGDNPENFYLKEVLHRTSGPQEIGGLVLPIVLGMGLTWFLIYWILRKGVRRVGKVVLITVPLPLILLGILLLRGITLPGAIEGLRYYLTPNFSMLLEPKIWIMAYSQIFFSLSLASGIMIAYGSFLGKKAEITNSAFIAGLIDCGTSFFAGFAVFSTLGYLAYTMNCPVESVTESGPGLAYIIYPTAINKLPALNSLFAIMFFIMLITLGIDSAFALQEAFTIGIHDKFKGSKEAITIGFCAVAFLLGLIFTTHGGYYWFDIVDKWICDFGLVTAGLVQCLIIGYLYGIEDFRIYLNSISEIKLGRWWSFTLRYVAPAVLIIILAWNFYHEINEPYQGYPQWTLMAGGWGMLVGFAVLGYFLYKKKSASEEPE